MKKPKIRQPHGPEWFTQNAVAKMLRAKGWLVIRLVGLSWQYGLPDLMIFHKDFGMWFVEIKCEDHYRWTTHQRWRFPVLTEYGAGIWILTDATEEQYERLFKRPNLWDYMSEKDILTMEVVNDLIDELSDEEETFVIDN